MFFSVLVNCFTLCSYMIGTVCFMYVNKSNG